MEANFIFRGQHALSANLVGLGRAVAANKLEEAGIAGGRVIANAAKDAAPRDTGKGADSIDARVVRSAPHEVEVAIGPGKDFFYMMFHEFGTSRIPAKPFLRPAFDVQQRAALDVARKIFRKNIFGAIRG